MHLRKVCRVLTTLVLLITAVILAGCGSNSTNSASTPLMGGAVQGKALTLTGTVSNVAGSDLSTSLSGNLATDGNFIYLAEPSRILKVSVATGEVTVLAGREGAAGFNDGTGAAATFGGINGITSDGANLYVTDSGSVRKVVMSSGAVTTLAGAGNAASASQDGTGAEARFANPGKITTDGSNLYVVETANHTIRKIVIGSGAVTTLAGSPGEYGFVDGTGSAARFRNPYAIAFAAGSVYVTDDLSIRKIDVTTGAVTTMAANGEPLSFAGLNGMTSDGSNLYVTKFHSVAKVIVATGEVVPLAGEELSSDGSVDGTGSQARFAGMPESITTDGKNLYVCDAGLRKITIATGAVTTVARGATSLGAVDGPGLSARFNMPTDVTTDGNSLFVTDAANLTIRKISIATGEVTTLAGSASVPDTKDGIGAAARFTNLAGITCDGTSLYVAQANAIRKVVIATGQVTTLAGGSTGASDGFGSAASFGYINGITTDGKNLYVTDGGNRAVRKVQIATGLVTTLAAGEVGVPLGITTDGSDLYVTDQLAGNIYKIGIASGAVTTLASHFASFLPYQSLTSDGGNLYVFAGDTLYKIATAGGAVTTVVDGLNSPAGITTNGTTLYYTSAYSNTINVIK
jgi:sugar lactone lactonase YvrE